MVGYSIGTGNATTSTGDWWYPNITSATDTMTITTGSTGGYSIQTPITYVAAPQRVQPPMEFNKYINASDLIEEFIKFAGKENLKPGEVLELPMDLFIKWLVIRACEEDQEEPNVTLALPAPRQQPKCLGCGQFMVPIVGLMLHAQRCAEFFFNRRHSRLPAGLN